MNIGAPKAGYELESVENVNEIPTGEYNVIVVDDELYDENLIELIKEKIRFDKIGIIAFQPVKYQESFDFVLPKPFLPTDLVELLRKIKEEIESSLQSEQPAEVLEEESQAVQEKTLEEVQQEPQTDQENLEEAQEPKDSVETSEVEISDMPEESDESEELTPEISLESVEREEPLVEVEEEEEEPPFVGEDLQKSGVLDEEEIKKVSELLEEEKEGEEHTDFAAQEPQDILTDFSESEEDRSKEVVDEEQKDALHEEAKEQLHQLSQSVQSMSVPALKQLLDGMELEIKIKISFPGK